MFKVKVVGQYMARSGVMDKEKIKKNYEVEGNIPTLNAALSIVKNKLLAPLLSAKYNDYVTYLTYHIVEITPLSDDAKREMNKVEIQYMSRSALLAYIKDNALAVDVRFYPDLFKLREAVQFAKEDPKGYAKHFELKKPDLLLDIQMAECNPQLFSTGEPEKFVASVSLHPTPLGQPTATKVKASSPSQLAVKTQDRLEGFRQEQIRDGDMGPGSEETAVPESLNL